MFHLTYPIPGVACERGKTPIGESVDFQSAALESPDGGCD